MYHVLMCIRAKHCSEVFTIFFMALFLFIFENKMYIIYNIFLNNVIIIII